MARAGDGRGMGDGGWLGGQHRVVEELESGMEDGDYSAHGVGSASSSSALALATRRGGDLRSRRNVGDGHSDSSEEDDDSQDSEGDAEPDEREQEMVEAALARIRRAQTKGKKEVKLSKEELAALERRRKRMQTDAERSRKKGYRVSVPLAQYFDMSASDMLPAHPSPTDLASDSRQQQAYPPVGAASAGESRDKSARRSKTGSSTPSPNQQQHERGDSPFRFSYVQHQQQPRVIQRHVSDTTTIGRPLPNGPLPREGHAAFLAASASAPSIPGAFVETMPNPFQFMTGGSPTQYPHRSPAAGERRHHSGPANETGFTYGAGPLPNGRGYHAAPDYDNGEPSDGASAEGSDLADDEPLPSTREPLAVVSSNDKRYSTSSNSSGAGLARRRGRSRESPIIVEDASQSPEPAHRSRRTSHSRVPSSKKGSSAAGLSSSPTAVRRKPYVPGVSSSGSGGGTRRRKK